MRFIIVHKTIPQWEAGAVPTRELIERVGALISDLVQAGVFEAGEGLRASSQGARLRFARGERTIQPGPFTGDNELPAGFSLIRAATLDDATAWATRQAQVLGDVELDVRPVTEPWDIGLGERPPDVTTQRYMVLRKATAASEAAAPAPARLIDETMRGAHLATETMKPSRRGRRYKHARGGVSFTDGPFTESKELIAGYVIITAASLDEVDPWVRRYMSVVGTDEVDVRELE